MIRLASLDLTMSKIKNIAHESCLVLSFFNITRILSLLDVFCNMFVFLYQRFYTVRSSFQRPEYKFLMIGSAVNKKGMKRDSM